MNRIFKIDVRVKVKESHKQFAGLRLSSYKVHHHVIYVHCHIYCMYI